MTGPPRASTPGGKPPALKMARRWDSETDGTDAPDGDDGGDVDDPAPQKPILGFTGNFFGGFTGPVLTRMAVGKSGLARSFSAVAMTRR